jgi:hypothetical protein
VPLGQTGTYDQKERRVLRGLCVRESR